MGHVRVIRAVPAVSGTWEARTEQDSWKAMAEPSLVVAVVHADIFPWDRIAREGQGHTWLGNDPPEDVSVLYVHGTGQGRLSRALDHAHESLRWHSSKTAKGVRCLDLVVHFPLRRWIPSWQLSEDSPLPSPALVVDIPDTYSTAVYKELALMEYFLQQTGARWLLMTTTSSYVRLPQLLRVVGQLGDRRVYAGTPVWAGGRRFASGANRLMTRDVVSKILKSRDQWDRSRLDDVGLGDLLQRLGLPLSPLTTVNVDSAHGILQLSEVDMADNYHFRLKSGTANDRQDVALMKQLHERLDEMA